MSKLRVPLSVVLLLYIHVVTATNGLKMPVINSGDDSGWSGDVTTVDRLTSSGPIGDRNDALSSNSTASIILDVLTTLCSADGSDGCYRRTNQEVTTSQTKAMAVTTIGPGHQTECNDHEQYSKNCVNHGVCFVTTLNKKRQLGCRCENTSYNGKRCQYVTFEVREDQIRTAHIAAGLSVAIIIVFFLLLALYVWHRYKKKERLMGRQFEGTSDEVNCRSVTPRPFSMKYESQPILKGVQGDTQLHPSGSAVRALNNNANGVNDGGAKEKLSDVHIAMVPLDNDNADRTRHYQNSAEAL